MRSSSAQVRSERPPRSGSPSAGSTWCSSTGSTSSSQTSPRAAGLAQKVQVDDVLAELAVRGVDALLSFDELTGAPLDVVINGSIKIARNETDAEQLRAEVAPRRRAGRRDREVVVREAATATRRGCSAGDALEISYSPNDVYMEQPRHDARWRSSHALQDLGGDGARRTPRSPASCSSDGASTAVETSRGPDRDASIVIDAAGAWTRPSASSSAGVIPLCPVRHQLCITEPLAEVDADAIRPCA